MLIHSHGVGAFTGDDWQCFTMVKGLLFVRGKGAPLPLHVEANFDRHMSTYRGVLLVVE